MRRITLTVLVIVGYLAASPIQTAAASTTPTADISGHGYLGGWSVNGTTSTSSDGNNSESSPSSSPPALAASPAPKTPQPPTELTATLETQAGGACIDFTYQPVPPGATPFTQAQINANITYYANYYLLCSQQPGQQQPPALQNIPAIIATETWQKDFPVTAPTITIPPGWALCGMPAYLVTHTTPNNNNPLTNTYQTNIPNLGTLTINATATYQVNWGDGTTDTTTYTTPGTPFPTGTITHTYDFATPPHQPDTITVTYTWNGTWNLPTPQENNHGQLPPLTKTTTLPLTIKQLQTIITYQS